ncbi:unnamed protein product [Plutella xylostella]|uniref:RNA-directed DNA polymerase n=1 Tax=Plutella xylostella TaxID=51655 RepID=A0A8S4E2W0_PLUXY|nr:unnamed protein product [Plutella xylostella]
MSTDNKIPAKAGTSSDYSNSQETLDVREIDLNVLLRFVKPFDGSRETLQPFINNCNNAMAIASNFQKQILFQYIVSQLQGKAETACSIKEFDNWNQLKDFLVIQFGEKKTYSHLLMDLQECHQESNETATQFALRLETCLAQLLTEVTISCPKKGELSGRTAAMHEIALNTFLLGLHPRLSNSVRVRNPKTLNEAINLAASEEKIFQFMVKKNPRPASNRASVSSYGQQNKQQMSNFQQRPPFKQNQRPGPVQNLQQNPKPTLACSVRVRRTGSRRRSRKRTGNFKLNTDSRRCDSSSCTPISSTNKISKSPHPAIKIPETKTYSQVVSNILDPSRKKDNDLVASNVRGPSVNKSSNITTSSILGPSCAKPVVSNKSSSITTSSILGPSCAKSVVSDPNLEKKNSKVYEINSNVKKICLPHILVETSVSKTPLSFLVDSGSSVCLVKKSSIPTVTKLEKEIIQLKGIDAGDELTHTLGSVNVHLFPKHNSVSYKFHVVENINLEHDGIIGTDLLKEKGCYLDYASEKLKLDKHTVKLIFTNPIYSIQPRTETVIECTISNPELKEGIIVDQHISDSLLVANCIVRVKENNRVNITVINTSEEPVEIHSDLKLSLEPLEPFPMLSFCTTSAPSVGPRTKKVLDQLRTDHLNDEESNLLLDVCAQYSDIFHLPEDKLTCTSAIEHSIETTTSNPIHTKTYRFPECHKREVENQINKMLEQEIISPSVSPWSAPIWVVPKKIDASGQKKWRVVIDYRKLNDVTIGEVYPIPQISEILDQLGQSKYFSTLDLASGFHQIKVSDGKKTAFSVPQGHFQFNRMPFGLKNAPSTFQKLMNTCLSGLQGTRCFVYLDDIVIYSHDLQTHIDNLSAVFERIRQFNLKLQPDKCEFLRKEVAYLGHVISDEGVKPNPDKIKAVAEFPIPESPKDIKSFLGLVSYYRRFIPDFSKTAKPLTSLLKKEIPFEWKNEQQLAFDTLKEKLTTAPILAYPDFSKPFVLTCDASNVAVSAILSQGPIGKDLPIAYASRTLNKAESNYSVTEKECLAIIFGTKTFRPYLYGHRFTIVTDHRPLQWLFNCKDPGSRLVRWRLKLEEYDYEILYKKGKVNCNADALSRYPVNPVQDNLIGGKPLIRGSSDPTPTPNPIDPPIPDEDLIQLFDLDVSPVNPDLNIDLENILPYLPSPVTVDPTVSNDFLPSSGAELIELAPVESTPSNTENNPINNDDYSGFLRFTSDPKTNSNTVQKEHKETLLKSPYKIILIPTSLDLDESNPYITEIVLDSENRNEIINSERELHSFKKLEYKNKIIYLMFTKVNHFDESSYPDIYKTIKNTRDDILRESEKPTDISISDFKNPFEKHSYTKIYNILTYLFHNTEIVVHVYFNQIIYPSLSERAKILKENHDIPIAGHLGSSRMYSRIQEQFYWKGMRSDIESYVKTCKSCQENKALRKLNKAPMEITSTSSEAFQRVALDIVGPLPDSGTAKLKYILTMQDDLTKYSVAYPIRSTTAEETSDCLIHFISLFGIPKSILTDQGTNFTSDLFKTTCQFLKIRQLWSSPYHPQTQGALERSHSTLKEWAITQVHGTDNFIHPVSGEPGIYFDHMGQMKIQGGYLDVVIPIDISYIRPHINNLNEVLGTTRFLCRDVLDNTECHNMLEPITVRFHDAIRDFEAIAHLMPNPVKRSAWFGGIGTVFKHVFGTLDQNDAARYDDAINLIQGDQTKIASIMKNNILVTNSVLQNYKDTFNVINVNEAKLKISLDKMSTLLSNLTLDSDDRPLSPSILAPRKRKAKETKRDEASGSGELRKTNASNMDNENTSLSNCSCIRNEKALTFRFLINSVPDQHLEDFWDEVLRTINRFSSKE